MFFLPEARSPERVRRCFSTRYRRRNRGIRGFSKGSAMGRRIRMAFPLLLLATSASAQQAAPAPAVTSTVVNRTSTTITGQPLAMPQPLEVVISVTEIAAGGVLPMHRHPWPRYAYVERGRLQVSYVEARLVREFGPGDAVIEAVDQWHEGRAVGPEPVRIVVIDHVPPGQVNMVRR